MSGPEFTMPAAPDVLPYLDRVADEMATRYSIDREEAVRIINSAFDRAKAIADQCKAEAAAGLDTPGARHVQKFREHGVEIGINLESESGSGAFMNRSPSRWAQIFLIIENNGSKLEAARACAARK